MTPKEIADALARGPTPAGVIDLIRQCDLRRDELRARLAQIHDSPVAPAERTRAVRAGPAAVAKLDQEVKTLKDEVNYLAQLGHQCSEAYEPALTAEARREIPKALRALPGAIARVRAARETLAGAAAELERHILAITDYERLEDRALPLTDAQLAELLELRNSLWEPLRLTGLQPPADGYPLSAALFWETRGTEETTGVTRIVRRPGPYPQDYGAEEYRLEPVFRNARR